MSLPDRHQGKPAGAKSGNGAPERCAVGGVDRARAPSLAAAQVLRTSERKGDIMPAIEEVWPAMLEHASRVYSEALKRGLKQGKRLASMLDRSSAAPER